jgi:hypothetical protein
MTLPHQRNKHPKYRKKYKIQNWQSYERSLINRGDLTLWLSEDVIESWNSDLNQRMGRPNLYSDLAIETALTLRLLFKLPLRQTEGFLSLGGGEIHQKGLLIASIPVMAVGANGKVAWSQVNRVVDITDWYVEQLQLDESGAPLRSKYYF